MRDIDTKTFNNFTRILKMDVLQNEGRQKIYVEGETFDIPEWNGVCVVSLRQKKKKNGVKERLGF